MKRILVLCVFFMLIGCDKNYHDGLLENLFGINGLKYKIICSNEEFSSGGEGFYYCVYELDKISLDKIINSKLVDFPVKPEYRANWEVVKWEKTPVKLNDLPLYKYCCEYHRPIDFEKCFSEIFEKKNNRESRKLLFVFLL
ncbi:hypothetical protein [Flavobacterium cerinum]|uniref:DUF4377 domain-containing protein n=1 Tax=Flavobacterium cerinum TaxID=2502784 RepID=A0ABY5IZG4_9FLAO|nr:hypothetical protein [Flavobacterium cerinum]UUC46714.1 hypothetical protein NOX80_05815 [Flavobacterium cerinum]